MKFFVRFLWLFSLLGFLFNLFTTYGNIQQVLIINIGIADFALSRSQYFFFFLVFFIVLNLALVILGQSCRRIPGPWLAIPFSAWWTASPQRRGAANQILDGWAWAIAATANYFMMYWMLVLENEFHFEGGSISSAKWFQIPGYIMFISLFLPLFRFFIRNTNLLARQERD